jgi:FkbM family methyltransferase
MRRYARHVIAFEPMPSLADTLREKFPRRVTVEAMALSDGSGSVELRSPVVNGVVVTGCSTISDEAAATYPGHCAIKVPMERLDNVYRGNVGFIKIDVEGHEQAVLDGAIETIRRCRPRMLVEVDDRMSPGGLERARSYFTHLGYRGFFVHDGHIKPIERFSIDRMQHPANLPDLTAPLQARQRFGRYIYNFIFLPAQEPEMTVWKMSERLHKLAAH